MTVNRGLFVRNNGTVGTTPIEGRLTLASLVAENAPGTPRNGLLDQKATTVVSGKSDMSYDVSAITAVVNRAAGEGVYLFTTTGTTNVATTAAPGTGSRYDLIYLLQRDIDKGDTDNTAVLAVYQGTAATSPTKPYASLPAGAYVLAEALVTAGAVATNGSGVTITQVWRYTALRGAPVPVRNTTERDEITPLSGWKVARLDLDANGEAIETYRGTAWNLARQTGPRVYTKTNSARVSDATGIAEGIVSGAVQPIIQAWTTVETTNGIGQVTMNFPQPFPNGVFTIQLMDGDTFASGGGIIWGMAGGSVTASLSQFTGHAKNRDGTDKANATMRVECFAMGW